MPPGVRGGLDPADDWESLADLEARGKEKLDELKDEQIRRALEPKDDAVKLSEAEPAEDPSARTAPAPRTARETAPSIEASPLEPAATAAAALEAGTEKILGANAKDLEAAEKAEARGVMVIQNRCPKIEYQRLFGELRMGGFATGVISSRLD